MVERLIGSRCDVAVILMRSVCFNFNVVGTSHPTGVEIGELEPSDTCMCTYAHLHACLVKRYR